MNFESFEDIKVLMDNFDPASLLPDLTNVVGIVEFITRIAVVAGPIVLLVMGVLYFFLSPKEANYHFGYRCYFGMGSVEAWRYTQRMAGLIFSALGLVLTVVMFFVSGDFGSQAPFDAMTSALTAVLWEAGLILVACLGINFLAMMNFTSDGDIRPRRTK